MEIQIRREIDFIPEWDNNQKKKEPTKIYLRYLTTAEMDDAIVINDNKANLNKRFMFNSCVTKIENLTIKDDRNKVTKITTAEALLESPGLAELYFEICNFIMRMNARTDSKNS